MNMRASRRGLSPLLAIIIGLVVTVVAGILLAQLYFSYAATISARPAANIEYIDLVITGTNTETLALSIKNTGNVPIIGITITGVDDSPDPSSCDSIPSSIPPGRVVGVSCSILGAYRAWNGTVAVTFSDGSTQIYAITARARYA
jgi:hypothetical protein